MPLEQARLLAVPAAARLGGLANARFGLRPLAIGRKARFVWHAMPAVRLPTRECSPAVVNVPNRRLASCSWPGALGAPGLRFAGTAGFVRRLFPTGRIGGRGSLFFVAMVRLLFAMIGIRSGRMHVSIRSKFDARRTRCFGEVNQFKHQAPSIHHARKPTRPAAAPIQALNS